MKLINIGFGNMVNANRLVAIVSPESAPIKRIIQYSFWCSSSDSSRSCQPGM